MKNILTITMNPAIDKSSSVAHVAVEKKLYCKPPRFEPGGGVVAATGMATEVGKIAENLALSESSKFWPFPCLS